MSASFRGLIAATHTPFAADGSLALAVVEKQAEALLADGVKSVFIAGTTGESASLTVEERLQLARRWAEVARASSLAVIVHVGANCLADSRTLAAQAESLGVSGIAALAPSYFKPANVDALVACCAAVAESAPGTPFYYYDIPSMTGVNLPMPAFLAQAAARIPTFAGLKFTNSDFMAFQECLSVAPQLSLFWGYDELLLPALAVGVVGAVGSTYNFAAPLYHQLISAFERNDLAAARREQLRSIQLIRILCRRGFVPSAKALMERRGVPVGPPRLPHLPLSPQDHAGLMGELEAGGFVGA
jgi:N-acetylneuraminate lyase